MSFPLGSRSREGPCKYYRARPTEPAHSEKLIAEANELTGSDRRLDFIQRILFEAYESLPVSDIGQAGNARASYLMPVVPVAVPVAVPAMVWVVGCGVGRGAQSAEHEASTLTVSQQVYETIRLYGYIRLYTAIYGYKAIRLTVTDVEGRHGTSGNFNFTSFLKAYRRVTPQYLRLPHRPLQTPQTTQLLYCACERHICPVRRHVASSAFHPHDDQNKF